MPKQAEENILMVVAYPQLNSSDYQLIQTTRQQYDENAFTFIKPHFTLVSPCHANNRAAIQQTLTRTINEKQKAFPFRLTQAVVSSPKGYHRYWYLFLTPQQGAHEINNLHQVIHQAKLQTLHVKALPFTPHLTIGVFKEEAASQVAADEINHQLANNAIAGIINSVSFITTRNSQANTLENFKLL